MMKKTAIILALCLYWATGTTAQTSDAALNKRLAEYLSYSKEINIDKILDYMYPRIFELAPKEQLKEVLQNAYNNKDIAISLDSLSIGKVLPISTFSKGACTKFSYTVKMTMKMLAEGMQNNTAAILQSFKASFGANNVRYDEAEKKFIIYQTKEALAIKDDFSNNTWSMLGLEKDETITAVIPAEIKKLYQIN
ncbi:MAG: hypothetical protein RL172_2015 [Bacteroidota bacterium]|jgi:hypothetical protein